MLLVGDEPYYGRVGFKVVPKGRATMPGPVDQPPAGAELVDGAFMTCPARPPRLEQGAVGLAPCRTQRD